MIKLPSPQEIQAEQSRRCLAEFIRYGWHVLEPATKLDWNWHIEAIALHVQAALDGWRIKQQDETYTQLIQNLLINVPPGTAKSRIVSVFTPAWMWLHEPSWSAIFLSANPRVALRDSMYCRQVLESEWYQEWFTPEWKLRADANGKELYRNTAGGYRQALGWNSKITGDRAHALFVDDPHDADEIKSDVMREGVLQRWDDAIANRVNDLRSSLRVGIMQRLHELDWSGHVLKQGMWNHLCLPMEYEAERACKCPECMAGETVIGWRDPRTQEGELLFPQRFPRNVLAGELIRLTPVGYAGQMQQRPAPKEGSFFKISKFEIIPATPANLVATWRAWDMAATEGSGAYTVGVKFGVDGAGVYYVLDVKRGQWGTDTRNKMIRQTAELDGKSVKVRGPQDPGAAGKDAALAFVRLLAGFTAKTEPVSGDKVTRADPYSAQVNVGNVKLVQGDWNTAFIEEHRLFPNGTYKDQVDAAADGFTECAQKRTISFA